MKLGISRAMLIGAALLLLGSAAYAQQVNVHAKVPFAFVLGDKVYPAGEYAIQTVTATNDVLYLNNKGQAKSGLILCDPTISAKSSPKSANQAKLVFHRVGDTYFLFQVWVGDSTVGRQFPISNRVAGMAMNVAKTESVSVAADIVP
jgi:hypothetical protein